MTDTDIATTRAHPLHGALVRAWNAVTWAIPPQAWIDTAVAALTAPNPATEPHRHDEPEALANCSANTLNELKRLYAETRQTRTATTCRHRELADLKELVRQRAIDTLIDNPNLHDSLHEALDTWNMRGIPTDHTVTVTVPLTITIAATDEADAREQAARLLEQRINGLGYEVSADLDAVQYTAVTSD